MNYIVHGDDKLKSVLQLGVTYRLTIGGVASIMRGVIKRQPAESWPTSGAGTLKDMRKGIRVMLKIADLSSKSVTITYKDAYDALVVCFYLSNRRTGLSPRLKSMLREAVLIFADCSPVPLQVPYVVPYNQLAPEIQSIPIVIRHYRAIEAKASLRLEAYPISLADAIELLDAVKGSKSIKMVLLRRALQSLTEGIREAVANLNG